MSEVKEYKCPSCGAPMYYDIKCKTLSCRFCKNTYDQEYILSHFKEETDEKVSDFDWVKRSKAVWEPYVSDKIEEFECPSCGGKIITRSSTATAKCPFCKADVPACSRSEKGNKLGYKVHQSFRRRRSSIQT